MNFSKISLATVFVPMWLVSALPATASLSSQSLPESPALLLAQSTWTKFTSNPGKFTVLMPGKPEEETETENTPNGKIEDRTFTAASDEGVFLVGYTDFDSDISASDSSQLLDVAAAALGNDGNKLLSQKKINFNGLSGREVEYESSDGVSAKARIFLVNQRLYQLHAVTSEDSDATKFLDSFQLSK